LSEVWGIGPTLGKVLGIGERLDEKFKIDIGVGLVMGINKQLGVVLKILAKI
jgi:hypothetical protein